MEGIREIRRLRRFVRIAAPDPRVDPCAGMVAVTELVDRLGMIGLFGGRGWLDVVVPEA